MANRQIYNDKVTVIPLNAVLQATQAATTWPSGTSLTATSSKPLSLSASISSVGSNATLVLTPLVQASTGISVTVSSPGLVGVSELFDIVSDPNLVQILIDSNAADQTTTQQAVPANPGP